MLYYFLCRLLENKIHRLLGIIVLGFTGYFSYIYSWSNYWNVNFSFTAVFFYGLGNLLQPFLTKVFNRPNMHVILLATICLILSVGFMFNQKPEFFINHLGKGGITHLVGVAGAVFMCCVAVLLSRSTHPVINLCKSGLKYFGKNSYVLLAFHQIIIMLFLSLLPGMPKILMHTFMWLTVVILIELITRRFPFILGREKKKEKSEVPCS